MERDNDQAGSLGINKPILQDLHSEGETSTRAPADFIRDGARFWQKWTRMSGEI